MCHRAAHRLMPSGLGKAQNALTKHSPEAERGRGREAHVPTWRQVCEPSLAAVADRRPAHDRVSRTPLPNPSKSRPRKYNHMPMAACSRAFIGGASDHRPAHGQDCPMPCPSRAITTGGAQPFAQLTARMRNFVCGAPIRWRIARKRDSRDSNVPEVQPATGGLQSRLLELVSGESRSVARRCREF